MTEITEIKLTPTYDDFPDVPWEIGMSEMVDSYRKMREKPYYTDEQALKNASVIYNSQRHEFLWGTYGLEPGRSRELAEKKRLAYERKKLSELAG